MLLGTTEWLLDHRMPLGTLLHDVEVHVRFLFAVPLLVLARVPIAAAIRRCVAHFTESELIEPNDERYAAAVFALRRGERSRVAEIVMLVVAFVVGVVNARHGAQWELGAGGEHLGLAGSWHAYVAVPIHQFLVLRWLFRWLEWDLFVAKASRMNLRLQATHADKSAGLTFLAQPAIAFALVPLASSSVLAARWGTLLVREPGAISDVRLTVALYLGLVMVLAFVPLLAHTPRLIELRHDAIHAYGALAQKLSEAFQRQWHPRGRTGDELLEANGPSAMIDFAGDYAIARSLRVVPLGLPEVLTVLSMAIAPLLTLAFVNERVADAFGELARAFL
jgi:hypothetical protein